MTRKEYLFAKFERNGIKLIANGSSSDELNEKLKASLRMWLIANEMFKSTNSTQNPNYFLNEAQKLINEAIDEKNLKVFNLSNLAEIFEGKRKISELVSESNTSDAMRGWACLWNMSILNEDSGGVLGEMPNIEELRWLVTDSGFYITEKTPTKVAPKTIDEKKKFIKDFINHFNIAFKFGAPKKTLILIAKIINTAMSSFYESQGSFNHLSIVELESMLVRRISVERANLAMGTDFVVRGLNSTELKEIIFERKSNSDSKNSPLTDFEIEGALDDFLQLVRISNQ